MKNPYAREFGHFTGQAYTKEGTTLDVDLMLIPLNTSTGTVVVVVIKNVTKIKGIEDKLETAFSKLEEVQNELTTLGDTTAPQDDASSPPKS